MREEPRLRTPKSQAWPKSEHEKSSFGSIVYSPSDLIRFMQLPFASWMDRYHLEKPGELPPDAADAQLLLVADEGIKHEKNIFASLNLRALSWLRS